MVFPVVMYGCESWTVKKAELWRIDAFELWCWRRLLRVPWTARSSNPSILKEISPVCSLEGLMLKLKLQYFGHLMRRVDSLGKTLMLGLLGAGDEGEEKGLNVWMSSPTRWTWVWVNSGSWWWTGRLGVLRFMVLQSQTWLSDWTEQNKSLLDSWVRKICWRRVRLSTQVFLGFPCGSECGKESACNAGDLGSIPGLRGYPGEGKGYPLQYSGLENSMECSPWVTKSWTWLRNFNFHFQ